MRIVGYEMSKTGKKGMMYNERLKRMLMMCGAIILFVLGVWLLIEPARASTQHEAISLEIGN